jgi:hypothetical protein
VFLTGEWRIAGQLLKQPLKVARLRQFCGAGSTA